MINFAYLLYNHMSYDYQRTLDYLQMGWCYWCVSYAWQCIKMHRMFALKHVTEVFRRRSEQHDVLVRSLDGSTSLYCFYASLQLPCEVFNNFVGRLQRQVVSSH